MKKLIAFALAAVLALSLCACANGAEGNGEDTKTPAGDNGLSSSPIGYSLKIDGVTFGIGIGAEDVVDKLGGCEPIVTESCGDMGGNDYEYPFEDFKILANDGGGAIRIYSIELLSDMVTTSEGIGVSAEVAEVKETYGEPTSESDTSLVYEKDGMKLIFFIENGAVKEISYREK